MAHNEELRKCAKSDCESYALPGRIYCSEHAVEADLDVHDARLRTINSFFGWGKKDKEEK